MAEDERPGSPTFLELAPQFLKYHIPVFPLDAHSKEPWLLPTGRRIRFLDVATDDADRAIGINRDLVHGEPSNIGLLAEAREGGVCFLEFDIQGGMRDAAKEMGMRMPLTLTQMSGRGYGHWVFRQTSESIALGNRSALLPDGKEWFSFRCSNKYIVGAGSIHPNGKAYLLKIDTEPTPLPSWVAEFVGKHTQARPAPTAKDMPEVDESFDFEDFLGFYGLSVSHENGDWHVLEECPGVGRRHEQSKETGFYYDGNHLGWSCFAQGCPLHGLSVGQVIAYLNEERGEPYRGVIWPRQSDEDWAKEMGIITMGPADDGPESIVDRKREEEIISTLQHAAENVPPLMVVEEPLPTGVTTPTMEAPPITIESPTPGDTPDTPGDTTPTPTIGGPTSGDSQLVLPQDAMHGRLGELAVMMKMPLGLAYPALLACYSALPVPDYMCDARVNLYVALIAVSGGGKNAVIKRALESLGLRWRQDYTKFTAGGDTQLCLALGDTPRYDERGHRKGGDRVAGPRRILIVNNEMTEVLKKAQMEGSSLAPRLCDFFDDGQWEKSVQGQRVTVDCRLSWLGGIPASQARPDRFTELFGSEANYGLYDRFLFAYGGTRARYDKWEPPAPPHDTTTLGDEYGDMARANHGVVLTGSVHPEAEALRREWLGRKEGAAGEDGGWLRLEHILMKIAVLSASANGEEEVSPLCLERAIRLMEWEEGIRRLFKSGEAKNQEAEFCAMALESIRQANEAQGGYVRWKRLAHDRKWGDRYGDDRVRRWVTAMIETGRLRCKVVRKGDDGKPESDKNRVMSFDYALAKGLVKTRTEEEGGGKSEGFRPC